MKQRLVYLSLSLPSTLSVSRTHTHIHPGALLKSIFHQNESFRLDVFFIWDEGADISKENSIKRKINENG